MKRALLPMGILAAALLTAAPASAAVLFNFTPGGYAPSPGYTIVETFDVDTGITGHDYLIMSGTNSQGASPATADFSNYLSVLGGGEATVSFTNPVSAFEFDWGSIDNYNTLTLNLVGGGTKSIVPGTDFTNTLANGNQASNDTNGLFSVRGTAGELFQSITLRSGINSFEIDNLAIPGVPEPTTWAMMLLGIAGLGLALRSRRGARPGALEA